MADESLGEQRKFGEELRAAAGDRPKQRELLREMVMKAGNIDEDVARRVFDAFEDAGIALVTEEGWREGTRAKESMQFLGRLADRLFPSEA